MKIYDVIKEGEKIPDCFDAVKVKVDGQLKSDLDWKRQEEIAEQLIGEGKKIFWEIDLGLFGDLIYPLNEEVQFRALKLSLKTFYEQLFCKYEEQSVGLCIYRGSSDFTLDYPWSKITEAYNHHENLTLWLKETFGSIAVFREESGIDADSLETLNYRLLLENSAGRHILNLFCRDVLVDYLDLITVEIPDSVELFVMIDATLSDNPAHLAQILSRERFEQFRLMVRGGKLPLPDIAWDDDRAEKGYISRREIPLHKRDYATVAICLPPMSECLPSEYRGLEEALSALEERKIHYGIIPEPYLTMEWDGLDYLLYLPKGLSDLGERKLQGFCAAGGTAVTLGEKIGLPLELSFDEWTEKLLEIL